MAPTIIVWRDADGDLSVATTEPIPGAKVLVIDHEYADDPRADPEVVFMVDGEPAYVDEFDLELGVRPDIEEKEA